MIDHRDPFVRAEFEPRRLEFLDFMLARGAEIREPTSEWEVVRYALGDDVHILYRNKRDELTYTGETRRHIQEFLGHYEADTSCEPTEHCSQPEDGGDPPADHCEDDPPWE